MSKWKRILTAFMTCVLFASLAACGTTASSNPGAGGNLDPTNPATVTLWHYYVGENQQALETAVSRFNQDIGIKEGVVVEAVAKGSIAELETAVTDSAKGVINSAPMPQIFSSYPDKAMEIDKLGMIVDLNGYFSQEDQDLYVPDFLEEGTFSGGRLLTIPVVKSTELLYVNATAWNEFAGETGRGEEELSQWESLYETARAYYEWTDAQTPDTAWDGIALMGFDSVANYIIIGCKQLGVNVIDAQENGEGRAVLDEEVLRRVFSLYYQGMSLGYFGAVGQFRSDDIKSGKLIAYVGSSSSAAYFPTWIEEDNTRAFIDFLPLSYPVFADGEAYAIQQGAGMCVAKSTPAQEEGAALFLKWFTAVQQNIDFSMTTGYLPVQRDAYASDAFGEVLEELRGGDENQQNVAAVYEIALRQIVDANTYAAKPFEGSYSVRSILQQTLLEAGEAGRVAADTFKQQGLTEEEILEELDVDARFDEWLQRCREELEQRGIAYVASA